MNKKMMNFDEDYFNIVTSVKDVTSPTFELTYFDFDHDKSQNSLMINSKTKVINVSNFTSDCEVDEELKDYIIEHNLDDLYTTTLINETKLAIVKETIKLLNENGSNFEELHLRTNRQKFFKSIFKKIKFPIYANNSKELVNNILKINNILKLNTIGANLNYVIVSPMIASLIQEDNRFVYKQIDRVIYHNPAIPDYIGHVSNNIRIIVDSYQNDNHIIFGSTRKDGPNIYICDYKENIEKVTYTEFNKYTKVDKFIYDKRCAVTAVGDINKYIGVVNFELKKKPLWRKLLKI